MARGMRDAVCTVNALSPELYEGTGDFYYGRRGHIPGSRSVYFADILRSFFFLPAPELRESARGARHAQRAAHADLLRWWYCCNFGWLCLYAC